ncbi:MAG: hypothetical protein LBU65_05445 [Planctomycetaceae bacterium]|jgi:hypothetical protein|nr:hypothetical protein [Planctomycetaceae bacterium]
MKNTGGANLRVHDFWGGVYKRFFVQVENDGVCKKLVGILAGYSIDNSTGHCRKKWGGYTKPTKNLHTLCGIIFCTPLVFSK